MAAPYLAPFCLSSAASAARRAGRWRWWRPRTRSTCGRSRGSARTAPGPGGRSGRDSPAHRSPGLAAGQVEHRPPQGGQPAEDVDVVGGGDVVAGVDDEAVVERREQVAQPLHRAALLEDGENGGLDEADDLGLVAAVVERLD